MERNITEDGVLLTRSRKIGSGNLVESWVFIFV